MITQQTGPNQVVHQRQDSTQELNNLFETSLKNIDGNSSWKKRDLPLSFFIPTNRSHSTENSIDGSQPDQQLPGPPSFHKRNVSCPVSMLGHSTARTISHHRAASHDMVLEDRTEHIPLPAGWEAAYTADGKTYFIE